MTFPIILVLLALFSGLLISKIVRHRAAKGDAGRSGRGDSAQG